MDILDPVVSTLNLFLMKRLMASIVVGIGVLFGINHYFPESVILEKIGPFAVGVLIIGAIIWDILTLRKEERSKLDLEKNDPALKK